jgi:hypothetical protein
MYVYLLSVIRILVPDIADKSFRVRIPALEISSSQLHQRLTRCHVQPGYILFCHVSLALVISSMNLLAQIRQVIGMARTYMTL